MARLADLLQSGPTELRRYGLAVDSRGRLVSIHEARAIADKTVQKAALYWRWPYRARVSRLADDFSDPEPPRRLARGTVREPE